MSIYNKLDYSEDWATVETDLSAVPAGQTWRNYIYIGAQRVAVREYTATTASVYYLVGDHLGLTSVVTSSNGSQYSRLLYTAWGELRYTTGDTATRYRFTGQREETALGLYDYRARFYDPHLGRFISPDSMVPEKGNPQGLDRYAYVANSPVKHEDTSGHCWGVASGIRGLPTYGSTCNNLDMALAIVQSDQASPGERVGAGAYLAAEGLAHGALVAGATLLACGSIGPCAAVLETALGIGTVACRNGDATNEVKVALQGFGNLSQAARFGIQPANQLKNALSGTGLQVHHLIEQRLASVLGQSETQARQWLCVAVTREEHRMFNNPWRNAIGYINSNKPINTATATKEYTWLAAQDIYAKYPSLLESARLIIFGQYR